MKSSPIKPYLVCFSAALFFFFEFMQMNMFNAMGPCLMAHFHMNASVLATISDKYFLANIIFLFPAGLLLDRVSTRQAIFWGLGSSVLLTALFPCAQTIWQMQCIRFLIGVGGSFCFLSAIRLVSFWFPPRNMAIVIGLIVMLAMLGGLLAQMPFVLLIQQVGWKNALWIDAIFGVCLLVIIGIFVEDAPHQDKKHNQSLSVQALFHSFWYIIRKKQNWLCGLYASLINLPILLLGALWGIFYLTEVRHFSPALASFMTLMLFVGAIVGSPSIGWISDRLASRKAPMMIGAVLSGILLLVLMYMEHLSTGTAIFLFFGIGWISSVHILSYPLISESNPSEVISTATGLASTLIMAGGFTQDLFAGLMQWNWNPHYNSLGIPVYSASNYLLGVSIMPIACALGLVLCFWIQESHGKKIAT